MELIILIAMLHEMFENFMISLFQLDLLILIFIALV
jgi:hypothetical protein